MGYLDLYGRMPDDVKVQTDRQLLDMTLLEDKWVAKESEISIWNESSEKGDNWFLKSSKEAIGSVMLRWKHQSDSNASILGDQWERGYGVKTNPNAFCFWQYTEDDITLILDVRCLGRGVLLQDKILEMATVVSRRGNVNENAFSSTEAFCKVMCTNGVLPKEPVYGGNNWYYAYGVSCEEDILKDTKRVAKWSQGLTNRPFMVIDACWQQVLHDGISCSGGPYEHGNEKFPDMKGLARKIEEMGVKPGIWCRPLVTSAEVADSWKLRKVGEGYTLDPTIPEVLTMIGQDIARISGWGYKLIKHDFTTFDVLDKWGFEMGYELTQEKRTFADSSVTTAQAFKKLYQTIFENAGDAYIIGCNTVGHLITGWAHIQRTGDDTSGFEWERTRKMGVNTLAFRMPQHNVFFASDADCVGLTKNVPLDLNLQWLDVLSKSGTPLFVSAAEEVIDDEVEEALKRAFALASKERERAVPSDWMNTTTPSKWVWSKEQDTVKEKYHWNDTHTMRLQWNDIKGNE